MTINISAIKQSQALLNKLGKPAKKVVEPQIIAGLEELMKISNDFLHNRSEQSKNKIGGDNVVEVIKSIDVKGVLGNLGKTPEDVYVALGGDISKIPTLLSDDSGVEVEKIKSAVDVGVEKVMSTVGINQTLIEQSISGNGDSIGTNTTNQNINDIGKISSLGILEKVIEGQFKTVPPQVYENLNPEISILPEITTDAANLNNVLEIQFEHQRERETEIELPQYNRGNTEIMEMPKPFGVDMVDENRMPKYKFWFVVKFFFKEDFAAELGKNAENMTFLVKTASRPKVSFDYEEYNMYNFKTKFLKRSTFSPIQMVFYDDGSNQATTFHKKYLELMIPSMSMANPSLFEHNQFIFDGSPEGNSSSIQPLPGKSHNKTILDRVEIYHLYDWGKSINVYRFHNPKITNFDLSDLDMESSEMSDISLEFEYDSFNILTTIDDKPISSFAGTENNQEFDINFDSLKYHLVNIEAGTSKLDGVTELDGELANFDFIKG
jgi:hypothetical protein